MKVTIYARVSSDSQDVDLSISAQLRALRDYANKHNYQVIREYVDEAESGRTTDRPAFRDMIALTKSKHPPFEAILVWKLNLDDLAPRIKELKAKQDELSKARVQTEADMVVAGVQHVDVETVKSYAQDLRSLLEEADFTQSKTFLRSFVERITIEASKAKIQYRLPMPPDCKMIQYIGVLPIDTPSGR